MEILETNRLYKRNIFFLLQGHVISRAGSALFDIALILWLKQKIGSGAAIGLIMMLSNLPEIILSPFCGTIVDMTKRKWILVFSDTVTGLAALSVGIVCLIFPDKTLLIMIVLIGISVLAGVCSSLFNPAVQSFIPELAPKEKLQSVNSIYQFSTSAALFGGQCLGGIIFSAIGLPLLILFNGISYLFSSTSEACINVKPGNNEKTGMSNLTSKAIIGNFVEGIQYIKENFALKTFLFIICIYHFFISPFTVILPFYVNDYLGLSQKVYGFFPAALGAGLLSGFIFTGTVRLSERKKSVMLQYCFLLPALCYLLLGSTCRSFYTIPAIYITGMSIAIIVVTINTLIQQTTPGRIHGRIFGIYHTLSAASIPVGMGFFGVLLDIVKKQIAHPERSSAVIFIFCGAALFCVWLVFIIRPGFSTLFREPVERESV